MLDIFGGVILILGGLCVALLGQRASERLRGEASIRATNLALAAEARQRAAAARYVASHRRDHVVHQLRRTGQI
jgi:hypothetical protein